MCFYQDLAYQDSLKGLGVYEQLKEERKDFCTAVHAEKNAFNQCTQQGLSASGASLYVTNYPCPSCVRDVIIPNRVREVVIWKDFLQNPLLTMDEYQVSELWLGQAKINVRRADLSTQRMEDVFKLMSHVGERSAYRFAPG